MKKILIIAAADLAFAGCAKEAAQIERVTIDGKEYMTFKVVAHDDVVSADTKATLSRGGVFGWEDGDPIYFVSLGGDMATGSYNASAGTITVESGDWFCASTAPFDSDSKIKDFGLAKGPVVWAKVNGSTLHFYHMGSVINLKFESIPIDGYLEFWPNNGENWAGGNFTFDENFIPELAGGGTDPIYIKRPIKTTDAGKDISLTVPNIRYENGFTVALSGTTAKYFLKSTSTNYNLNLNSSPTLLNMQQLSMPTYTVAGEQTEFFGYNWKWDDANNDMVLGADGKYRKTYKHTPDKLVFKVCENHAWENGKWPDATNYEHTVTKQTGGATIIFDRGNNSISVEEFDIYTVVGDTDLCGTYWGDTWTETYVNDMEETTPGSGVFYKQLTGITAGTYSFKVVANHAWDSTWGADGDNYVFTTSGGNVDIYFTPSIPLINVVGFSRDDYRIAGSELEIFGSEWDAHNDSNIMSPVGDGTYTKSYVITDDKYSGWYTIYFKVTREGSWWSPDPNKDISIIKGKTLTINYNPTKVEITASLD